MSKPNYWNVFAVYALAGIIVLAFASNSVRAQTATYRTLNKAEEVEEVVQVATSEILVVTDVLRSQAVADTLREAMVVRGVAVYILIPTATAEEKPSYIASLAYAGANVRLSEVGGSFIVIDRRYTVTGPLIGSLGKVETETPTLLIDDPSYTQQFVEGFRQSFEQAQVYTPQVEGKQ